MDSPGQPAKKTLRLKNARFAIADKEHAIRFLIEVGI
jgi:hypothetical protein